jgi:hypothetical protein
MPLNLKSPNALSGGQLSPEMKKLVDDWMPTLNRWSINTENNISTAHKVASNAPNVANNLLKPIVQQINTALQSTFLGVWNATTAYVPGNSVLYTNAGKTAFYVAIQSSTNKIPSSNAGFWQVTGSSSTDVFLGPWSATTTYFPGNQVTYNPSGGGSLYWICIFQSTGNAPTQASTFWQLVGTSAANLSGLDGVTLTPTALNLVYNGDFSIATAPTGLQSVTASAIRVQDLQNGGGIQSSCNGWTLNFETGGNG